MSRGHPSYPTRHNYSVTRYSSTSRLHLPHHSSNPHLSYHPQATEAEDGEEDEDECELPSLSLSENNEMGLEGIHSDEEIETDTSIDDGRPIITPPPRLHPSVIVRRQLSYTNPNVLGVPYSSSYVTFYPSPAMSVESVSMDLESEDVMTEDLPTEDVDDETEGVFEDDELVNVKVRVEKRPFHKSAMKVTLTVEPPSETEVESEQVSEIIQEGEGETESEISEPKSTDKVTEKVKDEKDKPSKKKPHVEKVKEKEGSLQQQMEGDTSKDENGSEKLAEGISTSGEKVETAEEAEQNEKMLAWLNAAIQESEKNVAEFEQELRRRKQEAEDAGAELVQTVEKSISSPIAKAKAFGESVVSGVQRAVSGVGSRKESSKSGIESPASPSLSMISRKSQETKEAVPSQQTQVEPVTEPEKIEPPGTTPELGQALDKSGESEPEPAPPLPPVAIVVANVVVHPTPTSHQSATKSVEVNLPLNVSNPEPVSIIETTGLAPSLPEKQFLEVTQSDDFSVSEFMLSPSLSRLHTPEPSIVSDSVASLSMSDTTKEEYLSVYADENETTDSSGSEDEDTVQKKKPPPPKEFTEEEKKKLELEKDKLIEEWKSSINRASIDQLDDNFPHILEDMVNESHLDPVVSALPKKLKDAVHVSEEEKSPEPTPPEEPEPDGVLIFPVPVCYLDHADDSTESKSSNRSTRSSGGDSQSTTGTRTRTSAESRISRNGSLSSAGSSRSSGSIGSSSRGSFRSKTSGATVRSIRNSSAESIRSASSGISSGGKSSGGSAKSARSLNKTPLKVPLSGGSQRSAANKVQVRSGSATTSIRSLNNSAKVKTIPQDIANASNNVIKDTKSSRPSSTQSMKLKSTDPSIRPFRRTSSSSEIQNLPTPTGQLHQMIQPQVLIEPPSNDISEVSSSPQEAVPVEKNPSEKLSSTSLEAEAFVEEILQEAIAEEGHNFIEAEEGTSFIESDEAFGVIEEEENELPNYSQDFPAEAEGDLHERESDRDEDEVEDVELPSNGRKWKNSAEIASNLAYYLHLVKPETIQDCLTEILPLLTQLLVNARKKWTEHSLSTLIATMSATRVLCERFYHVKAVSGEGAFRNVDLSWIIRILCKLSADPNSKVRPEASFTLAKLVKSAGPEQITRPIYFLLVMENEGMGHQKGAQGSKTKAAALDVLTYALLTFPKEEFEDLEEISRWVCLVAVHPHRKVRQAALECIAVLGHYVGSPDAAISRFRGYVIQEAETVYNRSDSEGSNGTKRAAIRQLDSQGIFEATTTEAISARLKKRKLPIPSPQGLLEYGVKVPTGEELAKLMAKMQEAEDEAYEISSSESAQDSESEEIEFSDHHSESEESIRMSDLEKAAKEEKMFGKKPKPLESLEDTDDVKSILTPDVAYIIAGKGRMNRQITFTAANMDDDKYNEPELAPEEMEKQRKERKKKKRRPRPVERTYSEYEDTSPEEGD